MERKIGEIFEFGGKWYQCIVGNGCENCAFNGRKCYTFTDIDNNDPIGECCTGVRKDNKEVIFKKLEKVGEPYTYYCPSGRIIYFQRYKIFTKSYSYNTEYIMADVNEDGIVSIEIKQNKEDMSNTETLWYGPDKKEAKSLKLSNLKPFDLEAAKAGKLVCTRDGRKARILCYDFKQNEEYPILVAVENKDGKECALLYSNDGISEMYKSSNNELAMLPEKKEGWVNVYKFQIYDTLESAEEGHKGTTDYIKTIRVEWEE